MCSFRLDERLRRNIYVRQGAGFGRHVDWSEDALTIGIDYRLALLITQGCYKLPVFGKDGITIAIDEVLG